MIERFSKILQTKTFSQSILAISATILSGLLGVLFFILVARILTPASFGLFSIAVITLTAVADIGDLGTSTGLIRFGGRALPQNPAAALKFLKLGLEVKLLVWLVILGIGWVLTPTIASSIFLKPDLIPPLRLAFLGVGGALLFSFISHSLQAYQKYKIWQFILVGSNLLRLLILGGFAVLVGLNVQNSLLIYIAIPFVAFLVGLKFLPNFLSAKKEWSIARKFFAYNKWIAALSAITALSSRLDTFLSTRFLSINEVGIYSVAVQLTSFMPQIFFAIATVAAPKLAGFGNNSEAKLYLRKLQLLTLALAGFGLILLPIGYLLIPLIYGSVYQQAAMLFVILYISQLIFLLALPFSQAIFYYFSKPQVFVPIVLAQLLIIIIGGFILINLLGIMGVALAVLLGNIFLFSAVAFWVIKEFRKK